MKARVTVVYEYEVDEKFYADEEDQIPSTPEAWAELIKQSDFIDGEYLLDLVADIVPASLEVEIVTPDGI